MTAKLGPITYLVVHHSASPNSTTLEDITRWHRERGWRTCGYHYVIERDGRLRVGRPLPELGAHVVGHNTESIGVCLTGDNTKEGQSWTVAQLATLRTFVRAVRLLWPGIKVAGHRDLKASTQCPGVETRPLVEGGERGPNLAC